jgi:hypothetical protein
MIKRPFLTLVLLGSLSAAASAATDAATQKVLVKRVHSDLNQLRNLVFDIEEVGKYVGVKLDFYRRGSITNEEIFRHVGMLRQPYSNIEYEARSNGVWVGLTLVVDRKHCLTPDDLNTLYPMGEGVPRTCDHCSRNDSEIGFGNEDNRVWILYSKEAQAECARQFMIEAYK